MIRFVYWLLVLIEVFLLLGAVLLFIVTDSRTIKYIGKTSLASAGLRYESLEGNLFDGLAIKELSYENKPLFESALIHWNPLTLFSDKISITELNVEGLELENIIFLVNEMKSKNLEETSTLDFSIVLNSAYLDINPYIYEGIKFSSFTFETAKIEIDKNLAINTSKFYLKFDSDIANVKMYAIIEDNHLLVDDLELKNISANEITNLTNRLTSKDTRKGNKKENNKMIFLKDIKVKHISGTMKPVKYGDFKIEKAILDLDDIVLSPVNNFMYQVEKVVFKGKTNFGKVNYKGYVKDANVYAKGEILLDKKLFKKYALPLSYVRLKKLQNSLHLNHEGVWIDIEHKVAKLLKIKSNFNLDVAKAKHKLHYDYRKSVFSMASKMSGKMTYANAFTLKSNVLINNKGFSYKGDIKVNNLKNLPPVVSEYLLKELKGKFKGDSHDFKIDLENKLLQGKFSMPNYKNGILLLKSKADNIRLNKLMATLPIALENEKFSFKSESIFNFKNFKKSKVKVEIKSESLDVDTQINLAEPYKIVFKSHIKNNRLFQKIVPKLKVSKFRNLEGDILFLDNTYVINIKNNFLKISLEYNSKLSMIKKSLLTLEGESFSIKTDKDNALVFTSKIKDIHKFLILMKSYYTFDVPNVKGEVKIAFKRELNGLVRINLKSPKLQYSSDTNIYNIELLFSIDKSANIALESYQFKMDDNGYLSSFYSTKKSYLSLKDDILIFNKFWLNDEIKIEGEYNFVELEGNLNVRSKAYGFRTKDFTLILDLDLVVKIEQTNFDIDGSIDILGDTITYEVVGTSIVEDSDIIIIEDNLALKESVFNNFKLYLKINSKKPLKYITNNVDIEFFNKISVVKNYNQKMLVTGMSTITKGHYQFEDKLFILDKSHLYFTGDVTKPLLDIKANYEKEQYNVHVFISGTTDAPIVNFNSEPYLTQQEILSLILFDGTGSSSGKGAEAYTLLGGSFAKGLIKSLGINVDHLLLGKDSQDQLSLEIGSKISKDISVLYLRRDGLDGAKVRIEHSKSFETDIIIQPPNASSIEFLYKQDR